jgi:hypothetical protein
LPAHVIVVVAGLPDVPKGDFSGAGVLRNLAEGGVGEGVGDLLVVVGKGESGALAIVVEEAALAAAVLANHVAEVVGFGGVVGDRGAGIVVLLDDVVLQLVPVVVDYRHG